MNESAEGIEFEEGSEYGGGLEIDGVEICQDPKKPLSRISLSDPIRSNRKHFTITILTYLSFVLRLTSNIIILIWSTSS